MEKDFFKNEIGKMFQFHKSVLLLLLKACLCVFRYGLWLLPWIFLAAFLWRPALAGWKAFTQTPVSDAVQTAAVCPPCFCADKPSAGRGWEAVPGNIETGVRTFERVSRQIRKK